jgi:hypothetical protein
MFELLSEEDLEGLVFRDVSEWGTWDAVLALLNELPWHRLHPSRFIRSSGSKIGAAVQSRSLRKSAQGRPFWRCLISYFSGHKARKEAWQACAHRQLSEW